MAETPNDTSPSEGAEARSVNFATMTAGEIVSHVEAALTHLGVEQLNEVIRAAEAKRRERQDEVKDTLLSEFRERAGQMGISLEELFPTTRRGRKQRADAGHVLPVKYRGPEGEEWSGRGQTPRWVLQYESQGRHREEFLV